MPGQRPQRLVPVRVREEADVHHDVGVERQAVLEPEALDRDLQSLPSTALVERGDQLGLQLVDVELGGVDHQIGGARVTGSSSSRSSSIASTQAVGLGGERVLAPAVAS